MLFTKSTEAGIQLENAMILMPELLERAQIPANNARISEWARDNHVNVMLGINEKSDFNCRLGIMMDTEVSDSTYNANKKLLKHLGDELLQFIKNMPSNADDAADEAIVINEVNKVYAEFIEKVHKIDNKLLIKCIIVKLMPDDE